MALDVASREAIGSNYKQVLRRQTVSRAIRLRPFYYLLALSFVMVVMWKYVPIYGMSLAFKDFSLHNGWLRSPWNDFDHFKRLLTDPFFGRIFFNTVWISTLRIVFAFPAPIIMALLLNEMRATGYKRVVQSVSYLPHFVSWVILGGILSEILNVKRGPISWLFTQVGLEPVNWLTNVPTFRALLVVTGIWQSIGWGTILYLAALSSVDPNLYEAAEIDGAGRFKKVIHITIPTLYPIMTILLLLQVGNLLDESFDQIFNMYNAAVYSVADIFDTFIYRAGVIQAQYDYTIAVGLFKNIVGLAVLLGANAVIRRYSEYGLW